MENNLNSEPVNKKNKLDFKDSKYATGRRKRSIAKVWVKKGSGNIYVNGIKMNDIFKIVSDFKKSKNSKPVIFMGYYNMIFQYGENNFLKKCKKSGVNGLIVVDLPWPENKIFSKKCKKNSINFIQLLSPTTSNKRLKSITKDSHDMIY